MQPAAMQEEAQSHFEAMDRRRSIRAFSDEPIPEGVVENCLRTAGTAPNGAARQPWHFVVVRGSEIKKEIRTAAEKEERAFYGGRASEEWLRALRPFGTSPEKPFLEQAPALIAVFSQSYRLEADGSRSRNYYVNESVGLACGFLVTALHRAGLACLVHTPSPMGFLNGILDRPANERAYLLLVVGYPRKGVCVPVLSRRELDQFVSFR
jgi:nitroreductase